MHGFIAASLLLVSTASAPPPADSLAEFRAAGGLAMQADLKSALPHLRRVNADELPAERRTTFVCMRDRFVGGKAAPIPDGVDPWTRQVIVAYRDYWRQAMMQATTPEKGEATLAATLAKLVGDKPGAAAPAMDALEPRLKDQLEARGYHALFGVTRPLREFMLWRKQSDETYEIDLPAGKEPVHVSMMDDFISYGWLGFATCDFLHSGGWATSERLFAVRSAYDLESEAFRVSYLAHEGQHFADYRRFPGLEQPELEYRAKLVEIANAQTTLYDLLAGFESNGGDDRATPHPWANRQVVEHLAAKLGNGAAPSGDGWKQIPAERLHAAARELLDEDSKRREAAAAH